jgi:acyl-CoA thioesterase-2
MNANAQGVKRPRFVADLLGMLEVEQVDAQQFTAVTGSADSDGRQVVEGSQVLAQVIVAVSQRFTGKSVRSAHAVFARVIVAGSPISMDVDVINEGRSTATAVVEVRQNGKRCVTATVLADVPTADVIRHQIPRADLTDPEQANPSGMDSLGDDVRFVEVFDVNSPDEVGPPELFAWFRCGSTPDRDATAKGLVTMFSGWFGVATTMRPHEGVGTSQAHSSISTAPVTLAISFHEPTSWADWLLYTHESLQAGAGMSYVRGMVHAREGALIASFIQEAIIRPMRTEDGAIAAGARM